jgi:sugar-specific transcriptional regulator TrmB
MAPTSFEQWFAIHNAKSENKIPEEYKALFEECWDTARINVESDNKNLQEEIDNLQDEIDCHSCPYDYCRCSDYDDVESGLEEANDKLRKVDDIRYNLKNIYGKFEEVSNSFNNAIENADYQLIVDSVKKDFDNANDDFFEVKRSFEALDI